MGNKDISFKDVNLPHENMIKSFQIPEWIVKQKCTKCDKELGHLSLRSIGLKLNAKDIGNFFVEVCCQHCSYGYELHIKNACKNIKKDFIDLLDDFYLDFRPLIKIEPDYSIPNDENNLVKKIIEDEKNGNI